MTPIETSIQAALARHPEIRLAILFGSLATGEARPDSDVDLALMRSGSLMGRQKCC